MELGFIHKAYLASLVLHILRTGAFILVLPVFGTQLDSRMLRFVLAVTLGSVFFWVNPTPVDLGSGSIIGVGATIVTEILIGFGAGLALSTMVNILTSAGEILAYEMGFAMAQAVNPESGKNSSVMSQLFQMMGFLLILQLNIHHDLLRFVQELNVWIPVGEVPDFQRIYEGLLDIIVMGMELAVMYSLPVLGVMLLLTATLVVLARAVQNINLMEFSFALRILLALAASAWFITEGAPFLEQCFGDVFERSAEVFSNA